MSFDAMFTGDHLGKDIQVFAEYDATYRNHMLNYIGQLDLLDVRPRWMHRELHMFALIVSHAYLKAYRSEAHVLAYSSIYRKPSRNNT